MEPTPSEQQAPEFYRRPPADQPRMRVAWLLLIVTFVTFTASALSESFSPSRSREVSIDNEEASVRATLVLTKVIPAMSRPGSQTRLSEQLAPVLNELEKKAKDSSAAAELFVATRHEASLPVRARDIKLLVGSPGQVRQAFETVYRSKEISKAEASDAAERLGDSSFARKLAKAHALEKAGMPSGRERLLPSWKGQAIIAASLAGTLVIFAGLALWAIYITARRSGQLKPRAHPAEPITLPQADRFALRFLTVFVLYILILFVSPLVRPAAGTAGALATSGVATLAMVWALYHTRVGGQWITLRRVGVSSQGLGKNVLWGIAGWIANVPVLLLLMFISIPLFRLLPQPSHPAIEMLRGSQDARMIAAIAFLAAVVAPFWEEVAFRGTLLPAFSAVLRSRFWGVIATSFFFASIHPQGLPLWLGLGAVGAMAAVLTYQTNSLIPAITLHVVHNSAVLLLGFILL